MVVDVNVRPMGKRVAVTGGSGAIGAPILGELRTHGWEVRSLDRVRCGVPGVPTTIVDVSVLGDLVSALRGFDAIVHLAAIPAPRIESDNRMFQLNTQASFNVLEAASLLGINHVVMASSINAMGMTFNLQPCVDYLPIDEGHPCRPDEPYGLSKLVGETLASGFARRYPSLSISSLRLPMVMTANLYRTFKPRGEYWRNSLWSFVDARDAARAVRFALEASWTGHEVFLIAADHTAVDMPTRELAARWYPEVPLRAELEGRAALISTAKAARQLGWRHEHNFAAAVEEFRDSPPMAPASLPR